MADDRLRELERRWQESGAPQDAAAYDQACRRASLPSPPRREAAQRLVGTLRAALEDVFDPRHLRTPCCDQPIWVGPQHTHYFTSELPLLCHRCTWSRRTPDGDLYLNTGRVRHLATVRRGVSVETFPLVLHHPRQLALQNSGLLVPTVPAPWPTKLLASLLRAQHDLQPNRPLMVPYEELVRTKLSNAIDPQPHCPTCGYSGYIPGSLDDPHAIQSCPDACVYAQVHPAFVEGT